MTIRYWYLVYPEWANELANAPYRAYAPPPPRLTLFMRARSARNVFLLAL